MDFINIKYKTIKKKERKKGRKKGIEKERNTADRRKVTKNIDKSTFQAETKHKSSGISIEKDTMDKLSHPVRDRTNERDKEFINPSKTEKYARFNLSSGLCSRHPRLI